MDTSDAASSPNGTDVVVASTVPSSSTAKAKHSAPVLEQPASKRQKVTGGDMGDMSFGFNNEAFSDHKLLISVEGSSEPPQTVHVSKLLVARASAWFRTNMTPATTEVKLSPNTKISSFVDIIKWMYFNKFDTAGLELLEVMTLAFKFKVSAAIDACAVELQSHMTTDIACKFIDNELKMRKEYSKTEDAEFGGFVTLWTEAKNYLKEQFQNFTHERWSSQEFKQLTPEGLKVVLSSDDLKVGTENTVFAAYREWMHHDFETRKVHAAALIPLIRFPLLHQNYLLDVVRTEADGDYPDDAKKQFAKKIIDAYVFHCVSADRHDALREFNLSRRVYSTELLQTKFYWKIDNISQKKEAISEAFFIGGYYLYLLFQRKNINNKGGGTIALYMHLKIKESGLGSTFYLPLAFELLSRNKITKKYVSNKGVYASPFTFQHRAWGYVDILGIPWDEFIANSQFNDNDSLHLKCCVAFKDIPPVSSSPQ